MQQGKEEAARSLCGRPELLLFFTSFLPATLARQCLLNALLFAGLQIIGVALDLLDDVFLLHLPLKTAQGIFQRLTFL